VINDVYYLRDIAMLKPYFKLIPADRNNVQSQRAFVELTEKLYAEIALLGQKDGYWGDAVRVVFGADEIVFGYPRVVAENLFQNSLNAVQVNEPCNSPVCHHQPSDAFCANLFQRHPITLVEVEKYRYQNHKVANNAIRNFIFKRSRLNQNVNSHVLAHEILSEKAPAAFLQKFFSDPNSKGIILGEEPHGQINSRKFIVDHLQTLKQCGVSVVCLEGFIYKSQQKLLDDYFESQHLEPPAELVAYARGLLPNPGDPCYSYVNLIKLLKQHRIRILAIDHLKSWSQSSYDHSSCNPERIASLNLYAKEIIEKEVKDGRYLAFVGSAHAFNKAGRGCSLKQLLPGTTSFVISHNVSANHGVLLFNYKETRRLSGKSHSEEYELEADVVCKY
jgi:hypothetical protein